MPKNGKYQSRKITKGEAHDTHRSRNNKTRFYCFYAIFRFFRKTKEEIFAETAKKYSEEMLTNAFIVLTEKLDKEKDTIKSLFALAIKSKRIVQ
jgi:hypothetical protein